MHGRGPGGVTPDPWENGISCRSVFLIIRDSCAGCWLDIRGVLIKALVLIDVDFSAGLVFLRWPASPLLDRCVPFVYDDPIS